MGGKRSGRKGKTDPDSVVSRVYRLIEEGCRTPSEILCSGVLPRITSRELNSATRTLLEQGRIIRAGSKDKTQFRPANDTLEQHLFSHLWRGNFLEGVLNVH